MDMHLSSMTKEELVARQDRLSITVADLNIQGLDIGGGGGGDGAEGNACESNMTLGTLSTSGGTSVADTPTGGSGGALPPKQIKGCLKRSSDLESSPSLPPTEFSRRYSGGGGGGDANRSSGSVVSASSSSKMQMCK